MQQAKLLLSGTPLGALTLVASSDGLTQVVFGKEVISDGSITAEFPVLKAAKRQLEQYFRGRRQQFDIPLAAQGTPFQLRVWQQLQSIPYATTCSYQTIAQGIGNPNAARAVGMANNKNPLPIIVPCHRVIGANGQLVGYGGGLPIKQQLIALEQHYAA